MKPGRIALLTTAVGALLGACDGDLFVPERCGSVSSTVTIRNEAGAEAAAFGADEPVTVQVVLANEGAEPVTIELNPNESCHPTYLAVRNASGATVWTGACPPGHLCLCADDKRTFDPGESVTIADTWDQQVDGAPAPGGTYSGHAVDVSECAPRLNDSRSFTLLR
jgi:hypothetical protein